MNGTVVFLGPSLPISRAQAVLPEATYLPPIRRGDLIAALHDRPAIVGIIDGQFLQSLAVSPLGDLRGASRRDDGSRRRQHGRTARR